MNTILPDAAVDQAVLVLVDLQTRLMPALNEGDHVLERAVLLLRIAHEMGVPVILSEQYPRGLGHTVPALMEVCAASGSNTQVIEKTTFSCFGDDAFVAALAEAQKTNRSRLYVVGCEAHVCVAQTVTDALRRSHPVTLVDDAIGSRTESDKRRALEGLARLGADVSGVEAVAFRWLQDAKHPSFKAVSELIKS